MAAPAPAAGEANPFEQPAAGAGAGAGAGGEKVSMGGGVSSCASKCTNAIKNTSFDRMVLILRILNLINVVGLAFASAIGFLNITGPIMVFLSVYIALFAILLLAFELRVKKMDGRFKRLFGFMFSFWGRTLFLMFLGSLCMALDHWATILIGSLTILNSCFNCFLLCQHPGFRNMKNNKEATKDPAELDADSVAVYLQQHPEVAGQVVGNLQPTHVQPTRKAKSTPPVPPPTTPRRAPPPAAPSRAAAPAPSESDNPFEN